MRCRTEGILREPLPCSARVYIFGASAGDSQSRPYSTLAGGRAKARPYVFPCRRSL